MTDHLDADRCAQLLKALADPARLRIVECLQSGPKSVSDVALLLEAEIANVSHHLRVMFNAGLVVTEREGKFIYYSLHPALVAQRKRHGGDTLDFGCCRVELGRE